MAKYRMDGTVVDTERASRKYVCKDDHDGRNPICRHTGSQWEHQTLYVSRKGRYYIEYYSQWQGSRSHVEWVSPEEAARWLTLNGSEIPAELGAVAEEMYQGPNGWYVAVEDAAGFHHQPFDRLAG